MTANISERERGTHRVKLAAVGLACVAAWLAHTLTVLAVSVSTAPGHDARQSGAAPKPVVPVQFSPEINDVLRLLDAGVDRGVIRTYIENSRVAYQPTADELIALQQRGVPSDLMVAMLRRGGELRPRVPKTQAAPPATPVRPVPSVCYPTPTAYPVCTYDYTYASYPTYVVYPSTRYVSAWCGWGWPWYGYGWGWPSYYCGSRYYRYGWGWPSYYCTWPRYGYGHGGRWSGPGYGPGGGRHGGGQPPPAYHRPPRDPAPRRGAPYATAPAHLAPARGGPGGSHFAGVPGPRGSPGASPFAGYARARSSPASSHFAGYAGGRGSPTASRSGGFAGARGSSAAPRFAGTSGAGGRGGGMSGHRGR
jgi:hypothetical protein